LAICLRSANDWRKQGDAILIWMWWWWVVPSAFCLFGITPSKMKNQSSKYYTK
jgi:hypothetical protein